MPVLQVLCHSATAASLVKIQAPIPPHLECHGVHGSAVPLLLLQALPRLNVPQPPRLVKASSACGRGTQERCKHTFSACVLTKKQRLQGQLCFVPTDLTQVPAHGVEGDAAQPVGVPCQRAQQLAVARPQLGRGVGCTGG